MTSEERLSNLELQLRRVKKRNKLLLIVIILVSFWVVVPAISDLIASRVVVQGPDITQQILAGSIRANEFVLWDKDYKTRAVLNVAGEGSVLSFCDQNGIERASLGVWGEGPRLYLADENGKNRIILSVRKGEPQITVLDENKTAIWRAIE